MKKYIFTLLVLCLVSVPVHADTQSDTIALLTQIINLLEQEIQILLQQQGQPPIATLPVVAPQLPQPVFGSVPSDCVANPSLALVAASTSASQQTINAVYSTGCPLDPTTSWSYTNPSETNTGTIGGKPNVWYVATDYNGNTFLFHIYNQNRVNPFSLTVGTTTQSI